VADDATNTVLDPALLDAHRQVREATELLPSTIQQMIRGAVSRIEDRAYAAGRADPASRFLSEDLGALLYEMHRDTKRLLDLLHRHGRLWQPEPGRAGPDVERLPLLAARIVAAAMHQPEPT
jgi:hypothetical protein